MDTLLELTSRAEASHFWFRGFRQFVTPILDEAAAGRTNLTVLDCGCGTGYNLRQLARYGSTVGVDLSAEGLAIARRSSHRLTRADAARLPFASASFDLVTSFDVLQCISNDVEAVKEFARVLKKGGECIGTVAAMPVLHGDHSVLSEEVRRYTRVTLMRLLRVQGFEPILVRYAFATLFPIMLGVRAAQRLRGARPTSGDITVPPGPINVALTALLVGEAALTRHLSPPFGSSLVFRAKKT